MDNPDRNDSLGIDQTLFPPPPPPPSGGKSETPPPLSEDRLNRTLGNMDTIGKSGEPVAASHGWSVLNEGLSLGGNYRLDRRLGRGGMGEAWKASDLMADRNVVIKLVPPEIRNAELAMVQVRETFSKVHSLQHQHICPIIGLIEDPSYGVYLVMKFINGKTLDVYRKDYIDQHGRFPVSEAIQLLWAVARALDYSHERKVLHRDVKPQNIMLSPEDGVQLIDFGLAAEIRSSMMRISETPMDMAGTRPYMSPEQWRGRLQDAKTDQYALAVTAYELIDGNLPFQAQDVGVLRECVLHEEPEPISGVADHVNDAIRKAMSKRREDRYENCRAFVKAMASKSKEPEKQVPPPIQMPSGEISNIPFPPAPPLPQEAEQNADSETTLVPVAAGPQDEVFAKDRLSRENFSPFWALLGSLSATILFLLVWFLAHGKI